MLYLVKCGGIEWGAWQDKARAEWEAQSFADATGLEFYLEPVRLQ